MAETSRECSLHATLISSVFSMIQNELASQAKCLSNDNEVQTEGVLMLKSC